MQGKQALLVLATVGFLGYGAVQYTPIKLSGFTFENGRQEVLQQSTTAVTVNQLKTADKFNNIEVDGNLLTLSVTNQALHDVAKTIAEQANLNIIIAEGLDNPNVNFIFDKQPLQSSLQKLFAHYDTFFLYSNETDRPAQLTAVWVYPKGMGALLSPLPAMAQQSQQVALNTDDPDPNRRAAAITSILEQQGDAAADVLQLALDDPDEKVRMHALHSAGISSVPMPFDKLKAMALKDASATIRSMALAALYQQFEEKRLNVEETMAAVNLTLNDPDPVVTELAKQIMANLEAVVSAPPLKETKLPQELIEFQKGMAGSR
jgi:hypothetical protein